MNAVCIDKSYTFRKELTINKEYKIIRFFDDHYAHYPMVEIINNEDRIHPYRANRFVIDFCLFCAIGDDLEEGTACVYDGVRVEGCCPGFQCSEQNRECPNNCMYLGR